MVFAEEIQVAQKLVAAVSADTPVAAIGRSPWVRALIAGLLAAIVTLLAGCAGGSPGVVAYVGDSRISETQLRGAVAGVQESLAADGQQVSDAAVVNVLIHGEIANQIAAQHNVTVTDAQRDALVGPSNLAPLLTNDLAKPVAYALADQQLVAKAIGPQAYTAEVAAIDVTLNPRFGVLDPASKTIIEGASSSLSLLPQAS